MNHDHYADDYIGGILKDARTIALVGASPKPDRPSNGVMAYLLSRGYHVIPVNPGLAGKEILGQPVFGQLSDIPEPVDMVDVFRAPEYLLSVVEEALAMDPQPKVVWSQLGIRDDAAAAKAEAGGIRVVMNRCPAIEIPRLGLV